MGICRSCFHVPTDEGTSNERSPLRSSKPTALHQQVRVATAWDQPPTRRGGQLPDAVLPARELLNVTSEGRSSSVKTVEPPYFVRDSERVPCVVAAVPPRPPPTLSAVNRANYHQLSVMLGIGAEDARIIIDTRRVLNGFGTLHELLTVSGIAHDTRHKIEQRLCIAVEQGGVASGVVQETHFREVGGSPLRVATWNLQQFTTAKAHNRPLVGAVCSAIINSRIDILAVQELGSQESLEVICDELCCRGPHRWECVVSDTVGRMFQGMEYHGLLWRVDSARLCQSGLLGRPSNKNDTQFVRTVFMGAFKVHGVNIELMLASVHLKAVGYGNTGLEQLKSEVRLLPALCTAIQESTGGRKELVLLGDFNMAPDKEDFHPLVNHGYVYVIPGNIPTNISTANLEGTSCYDNIWVSQDSYSTSFTGNFEVVRGGLVYRDGSTSTTNCVSDHCPVWAEFNFLYDK